MGWMHSDDNGDTVYVYEAMRRSKDNDSILADCPKAIRRVQYSHLSEADIIKLIKEATSSYPGVWRIYRSVNLRDARKSKLELSQILVRQLVTPFKVSNKNPESLWKTILMSPDNKAERLFLVDVDTKDKVFCRNLISHELNGWIVGDPVETPNGWHLICQPFNSEIFKHLDDVEIKKDALLFIERYKVSRRDNV